MKIDDLNHALEENTSGKLKKRVRGGKLQKRKVCKPGFKWTGDKCVPIRNSEKIKMSIAGKKSNRTGKQARKRSYKKSMRKRKQLGLD